MPSTTSTQTPSRPALARPGYPPHSQNTPSADTSTYQSYSSTESLTSQHSLASQNGGYASAPLPSPSSSYPNQHAFFGSLNHQFQPSQYQAQQAHVKNQGQQQQQRQQYQYQQYQQGQRQEVEAEEHDYRPHRDPGAGRTAAETNSFLMAEALLAEAAKRAQVAVVMRDIEGMEL